MVLDTLDRVQLTLDYMEQNLKAEIQAKELSKIAGYSEVYYSELFKKVTGIPMGQYLTRRKLAHAICEIAAGRRMLETALEYGFDTYAGFYRAFCREYGCSQTLQNQFKAGGKNNAVKKSDQRNIGTLGNGTGNRR